jgi:hypothetical protein
MGYVEVDDVFAVDGVGDTIFPQVSDYLKLYHNGKF